MSEQNMTSEIVSLRNENAVLKEELALANHGSESRYSEEKRSRQLLSWKKNSVFSYRCSGKKKSLYIKSMEQ
ncbi:hypothetical protein [Ruminococcus albus]|uniref:Transposase n=1 Tax=Ruminococcus albus TaxID=1264 RepID=A0A1H7IP77_RUMAL|nr:hypothetical protein [Ruminococcus albus]SEK64246.1 hypothetical protein SAMN05216469_10430 [Ruminococcus albus]